MCKEKIRGVKLVLKPVLVDNILSDFNGSFELRKNSIFSPEKNQTFSIKMTRDRSEGNKFEKLRSTFIRNSDTTFVN